MSAIATSRLLEASATLEPADRALLNLWVNRRLDDGAVARLTGMTESSVTLRRAQVVERLSTELGLPPELVTDALDAIASGAEAPSDPVRSGAAEPGPATTTTMNGSVAWHGSDAPSAPSDPPAERPEAPDRPGTPESKAALPVDPRPPERRRRGRGPLLAAMAMALAVVVVTTLGSNPARHPPQLPSRSVIPSAPRVTGTRTAPGSTPSTAGSRRTLVPLPGLTGHALGSVEATRSAGHLTLKLRVRDLPAAVHGHYELWLYNSILDSAALGPVDPGASRVTLRLAASASHFRWIDISFQPEGVRKHSGQSVLRAPNPAAPATA